MKKLSFLFAVLFFVFAVSNYAQPVIKSGRYAADYNVSGYGLHINDGVRSFEIEVVFDEAFSVRPEVLLNVDLVDVEKSGNTRYKLEVKSLNKEGFIIKITAWADTKVNGLAGSWLAYTK
ncbi:MAG: H-type lectin domain-containing protein [bacterium]